MSTELVKTEQQVSDNELTMHLDNLGLTSKLTPGEKNTYLQIAKAFNLNPFKREIHVSKYGEGQFAQMSIITGYEVYIKRAERSGQLDGWSVRTEGKPEDNSLKAIITIYRKDRKHPFEHEVYYSEYVQKTKTGEVTKFWQKAYTMIKKVAMSQGFRLCFSDELGGMPYTSEEMPEPKTEDIYHVEIKQPLLESKVDLEEMKAILIVASSEEDLTERYKSLPVHVQKNEEIISLCRTIKQGFTNP